MTLASVVIVYETEAAARARLVAFGYPPEIAAEVAVYLGQSTDLPDFSAEIATAMAEAGLTVDFVELDAILRRWPAPARRADTMIWPLTDGIRYYRGSAVAALARLDGFAQFGSSARAQHLCQDKFASLALAATAGIAVPPTRLIEDRRAIAELGDWSGVSGPYFVKPNTLGAKVGIFADSRCAGLDEALTRAERLWERYRDRALIQPFIAGDDVRVSFLDLGMDFEAQLGIEQLAKDPASDTGGAFMTMKDNETLSGARDTAGRRGAFGEGRKAAFVPRLLDLRAATDARSLQAVAAIRRATASLAGLVGLRDYFSLDFRIDAGGTPLLFEFEVCPGVTIYDFQNYLHAMHGLGLGPALARAMTRAFGLRFAADEA